MLLNIWFKILGSFFYIVIYKIINNKDSMIVENECLLTEEGKLMQYDICAFTFMVALYIKSYEKIFSEMGILTVSGNFYVIMVLICLKLNEIVKLVVDTFLVEFPLRL